jgi:hypothetical protein
MKSLLHIGHDAEKIKEAIPTINKAILEILNCSAGDEVKKKALDIIGMNVEVKNISVSGCSFTCREEEKGKK